MSGLYVHIPFCKSRCRYCDFYSTTLLERRHEYVDAVLREYEDWCRREPSWGNMSTLYFGGGTPSLLETKDIERMLRTFGSMTMPEEITLEANPGDLNKDRLLQLKELGINRLSIGIQSFQDSLLQIIGRRHSATDAQQVVEWAQEAGFSNISIDLIYGLPTQTMKQWEEDVQKALSLHVQHISSYCLTYEEGTPLTQLLMSGKIDEIDEEEENRMYDYLCEQLTKNGYCYYEVSNFAKDGYHSRHNSSYWNNTPYLGLGAAAHSYDGRKRWSNPSDLQVYINGILGDNLEREEEILTEEQKRLEAIMLGLRTNKGIDVSMISSPKTTSLIQRGLLVQRQNRLVATQKGIHILNTILTELI